MSKRLTETTPLSEAGGSLSKSGRMKVHAITAGLGSSGYYSPEVLQEAATNGLIAKGTPLFLDHPSEIERHDRPERSVRDIAAVFTEAATYDAAAQALAGEIQVFAPYRDLLTEMAPYIGLSISGSATDITEGEVDGRRVPVVEGLARIDSVDWVTRAGRGGKVVGLIESARFISEATADDRAQQLADAVRAAHAGNGLYAYVTDQDAESNTVWFRVSSESGPSRTYQQTYVVDANDVDVSLTGDPVEVRRRTDYVPVNNPTDVPVTRPGSTTTITATESEEDTMPKIQIEESEHNRLTETAGRVDALESENATLKATVTSLQEADQRRTREDRARAIVAEKATAGKVEFTDLEVVGLVASAPVKEDGTLDEDAFATTVDAQVETRKTAAESAAPVHGFGASAAAASAGVAESGQRTSNPWGRPLTEQKGA